MQLVVSNFATANEGDALVVDAVAAAGLSNNIIRLTHTMTVAGLNEGMLIL